MDPMNFYTGSKPNILKFVREFRAVVTEADIAELTNDIKIMEQEEKETEMIELIIKVQTDRDYDDFARWVAAIDSSFWEGYRLANQMDDLLAIKVRNNTVFLKLIAAWAANGGRHIQSSHTYGKAKQITAMQRVIELVDDVDLVKALKAAGCATYVRDPAHKVFCNEMSNVYSACRHGRVATAKWYLETDGAMGNTQDRHILLHAAVLGNNPEVVRMVIRAVGSEMVFQEDADGMTPMHLAVSVVKNADIVQILQAAVAEV